MIKLQKYHIFGYTVTPIFAANAKMGGNHNLSTKEQAFCDKLHIYTIVAGINDGIVLPTASISLTIKRKIDSKDKNVEAINVESALLTLERVSEIVSYILDLFDQKACETTDSTDIVTQYFRMIHSLYSQL